MPGFKKFWIVFLSFLPFSAGAAAPLLIGAVAGIGVVAGFSIYRSYVPVDMAGALDFFSSCWSCQMFGDIMATMSGLLPRAYSAIGLVTIPVVVALSIVWISWRVLSGYIGQSKIEDGWALSGKFGTHIVKLGLVVALLAMPLPRLLSDVVIEPIFGVGFTIGRVISTDFQVGTNNQNAFETCLVATAVADPAAMTADAAISGAFSPRMRHNLTCQLAGIHQMTAVGMTVGWAMLNSAFDKDYMHAVLTVPAFPNVPILLAGIMILVLFFFALLPVPLYLLKVFLDVAIDLIMLPLTLLSWLFSDWKLVQTTDIKTTINNLVKNVAGIAMIGIFISFSIIFMNVVFSGFEGVSVLQTAFANNDPKILMDGLMMNNDSLVVIILIGLFLAMFMTMMPTLINTMFANVKIPDEFYNRVESDTKALWGNVQKWYKAIKK